MVARQRRFPAPYSAHMVSVAAVIPGYQPDVEMLLALVRTISGDGIPVLVVDDGSPDATYLERVAASGATTVLHGSNTGIARSLNDGLFFAQECGAEWLLTVDQDTVVPAGYVSALLEASTGPVGVVGAETIGDASGDFHYPARVVHGRLLTEEVFQTGSLWRVDVLANLGGFDERLGMDAVDAEACLRLRENGYAVALAAGTRLGHRLGATRRVKVLGHSVAATGHSPARRESMVRNRLRLLPREFHQSPAHAIRTIRRLVMNVALAITIEDDRWEKAKASARGLLPARDR